MSRRAVAGLLNGRGIWLRVSCWLSQPDRPASRSTTQLDDFQVSEENTEMTISTDSAVGYSRA
jgi:hypothetical protein